MNLNNAKENNVLIVEPNPYHGEILPGFVKYFRELGCNTDLLVRNDNKIDDIFCRFDVKPKAVNGSAEELKNILKNNIEKKYDYIFLSSSAFWEDDFYIGSYIDYLGFIPKAKNGILMVEHNIEPYLKEYKEEEYANENRLFTLSGFQNTLMLNPHFFGEKVKITSKSDKIVNFIAIGGILKNCKNHDLLISAISSLAKENQNFLVTIIGFGNLEIPENIKKFVNFKGRTNYEDMYYEIEKADYILPLLDYSIEEHKRYIDKTTTGARQLVMGFLKPCIIEKPFAVNYGFNENNSIIYDNNNLLDGMKRGIALSCENYKYLQDNLKILEQQIYNLSLENLRKAIKENA